jgi:hypothetical protein
MRKALYNEAVAAAKQDGEITVPTFTSSRRSRNSPALRDDQVEKNGNPQRMRTSPRSAAAIFLRAGEQL